MEDEVGKKTGFFCGDPGFQGKTKQLPWYPCHFMLLQNICAFALL
jgi:hypothetical protein